MEVKAVFFDIDGTLVNDRKSVLKSTKEAIKIVKEQGVLVGVATGRGPFFVKDLMDDLRCCRFSNNVLWAQSSVTVS